MPTIDRILQSEFRRRCLKPEEVEVEPVLWSANNPVVLTYSATPGGVFYIIEKVYGIELGTTKVGGTYALRSERGPLSLGFGNVQNGTPAAGILAQAAPWTFDHPTLHEGALAIDVSGIMGQWTLNIQMLVVHVREGGCEKC